MQTYAHPTISKITERGQITLPKSFRTRGSLRGAHAVEFIETAHGIIIRPMRARVIQDEQTELFAAAMGDWSNPAHDDLFDFTQIKVR